MWSDLYPAETDTALSDMAAHPRPPKPREPSVWAKAGTLLASPYTGAAQGLNESLRVANRALSALPSVPSVRERNAEIFGAIDETLRSGAEYWAPDAQTSTFASEFIHGGARVLSKVAGYSAIGGPVGALVGTTLDEAGTQYLTLRDKGVDPGTAAAAGAVRGASTAVGFAIPVAGSTIGRTAALAVAGGPLSTFTETAVTREILARADYADLASQLDPWDPALLGASIIPGAAFGIAAHAGRARRAKAATAEAPQPDPLQAVATEPGMVEAAHVALQRQAIEANMLGDAADPQARVTHQRALDEARRALDSGEPMRLGDVVVDEGRARAAAERLVPALRAMDEQVVAERPAYVEPAPAPSAQFSADAQALDPQMAQLLGRVEPTLDRQPEPPAAATPAQRADRIAVERPDMPVRMDENEPSQPVRDVLTVERQLQRDVADEVDRAHQAAIECFLKFGD